MFKKRDRNEVRVIRHARVRKKISGTPEMPRLCVYRSNKSIYAQVIDDTKGITLVSASTLDPQIKGQLWIRPALLSWLVSSWPNVPWLPASRTSSLTAVATSTPGVLPPWPPLPAKPA